MAKPRPRIGSDDELMTTKRNAEYLSVTTDHLYHLAAAGVGPPRIRVGGRWYYLRSEVDEWVLSEPDLSPAWERQRRWQERRRAQAPSCAVEPL